MPATFTAPLLTAGAVLVFSVDLGAVASMDQHLDRVGVISGASVYPLVWNVLLAARQEGFGGTITTMAVAEEPMVQELFGVPEQFALAAVVPLGRLLHQPTKLKRRAVAEFVTREHFSGPAFRTSPTSTPGEKAEVDFGEVWVAIDEVGTKCHMFVLWLAHSGKAT